MPLIRDRSERTHHYLKQSFSNVKKDTSSLFEWVQYLNQRVEQQDQTIIDLHQQFSNNFSNIKHHLDNHPSVKQIHLLQQRISQLNKKIDLLGSMHDTHSYHLSEIRTRLESAQVSVAKKSTQLKEKILKNIARNSKSYIKTTIINYLQKYEEVSALQLKEMIVDEQHLCSKSSFYRLLQELEDKNQLAVVKEGKQKVYLAKAQISRRLNQ